MNTELKFDVKVQEGGLPALNKLIREQQTETTKLIAAYGKESQAAKDAANKLGNLRDQKRQLLKATNELGGGLKKSSAQLLEMGENITVVAAGIKVAISAVTDFSKKIFESAKQGTEFGVLKDNFEQLSGGAEIAKKNIELLYAAVAGNIDKKELMGIANEYKFLGLSLEDTARLLDGIETRGDAVKLSFESALSAINSFVMTGREHGLVQGLKFNIADVRAEFDKLVIATGKSKDELTDDEEQALRLQTALKLLGTEAKTTSDILNKSFDNADKLASIETRYRNIKDELSLIVSGNVVNYIDNLNKKFEDTSLQLEGNETAIQKVADAYQGFVSIVETFAPASLLGNLALEFNKAFESITEWLDRGTGSFNTFISALNVSPNTSWAATIINALNDVYDAARDAYNAIFDVQNTTPQSYTGDLTIRVPKQDAKDKVTVKTPVKISGRGGTTSRGSETINEEKQILNIYQEQEKIISDLQSKLLLNLGYTGAELEINRQILEAKQRLYFLETGRDINKAGIIGSDLTMPERNMQTYTGGTSFIQSKDIDVLIAQFTEPFIDLTGNIKNVFSDLMNVLDADAESFVGKMVNGFDKVLSIVNMIVNTLNAVNAVKGLISTIASIIPGGGAVMGMAGGMPMPMMQSGSSRPIVNVVVQSEVEKVKAIKFFDNNFNAYQNYLRANSY